MARFTEKDLEKMVDKIIKPPQQLPLDNLRQALLKRPRLPKPPPLPKI